MNTIDDRAATLLNRLDEGYSAIDPTNRAAVDAFWIALFEIYTGGTMTTTEHIEGLELRIAKMEQRAAEYERDADAVEGTGPMAERNRTMKRVSAVNCRYDAMKHRAILAGLRETTA